MISETGYIGLGTFPFANVFTHVDNEQARNILLAFIDHGGRYIDSAPVYALGQAEELLGAILKDIPRESYYLSSKCGYVWDESKQPRLSGKFEHVIAECEKSLKRLNVDYLDLYMSHVPDPDIPFSETMEALNTLKDQGKIREIAVSNVNLDQLMEYRSYGDIRFVQNRFSLLNQCLDARFVDYCLENDIGITPYQIIERGLLTSKAADIVLDDNDLRNKKPEFASQVRLVIGKWVKESLLPIAKTRNVNVSSLVIWWALQQPAIPLCIVGATRKDQVDRNFDALTIEKSQDLVHEIDSAYAALQEDIQERFGKTIIQFMGLAT